MIVDSYESLGRPQRSSARRVLMTTDSGHAIALFTQSDDGKITYHTYRDPDFAEALKSHRIAAAPLRDSPIMMPPPPIVRYAG